MHRYLLCLLLLPMSLAWTQSAADSKKEESINYFVEPSFSFSMSTEQSKDDEELLLTLYGRLRSQVSFDLWDVHVKSFLNADFKRLASSDAPPRNLKDDLIFSVIPSVHISETYDVSLFLELTMETDIANGTRDGQPTSFMDPAFFYETIYVGQWVDWKSDDKAQRISMRYGIGYAFQQTVTSNFLLASERRLTLDPDNPLSAIRQARSVKLESGYSALFSFEYLNDFTDDLNLTARTFGVALSKGDLGSFFNRSHLIGEGELKLQYKMFLLRYDVRVVFDPNYSQRRLLDQSASFGISFRFRN